MAKTTISQLPLSVSYVQACIETFGGLGALENVVGMFSICMKKGSHTQVSLNKNEAEGLVTVRAPFVLKHVKRNGKHPNGGKWTEKDLIASGQTEEEAAQKILDVFTDFSQSLTKLRLKPAERKSAHICFLSGKKKIPVVLHS